MFSISSSPIHSKSPIYFVYICEITEKWNEKNRVCGERQQSSCTGKGGPALAERAGRPSAAYMS